MSGEQEQLIPETIARIRSLFDDLPAAFAERHEQLRLLRNAFHEELAKAMQRPLNEYIAQLPQDSLSEKMHVASYVNELLRGVGLTVKDPRTGRSALLVADTRNAEHPEVSRFRFEVRNEHGKMSRTFSTQNHLPELDLMQDFPRKDYWAKRQRERGGRSP